MRGALLAAFLMLAPLTALAQDDVDALIATTDERTQRYDRLVEIMQGADATRALAAFDVMVETDDPTMIEVAVTAALGATDTRLRARALWEVLRRKDSITIIVATDSLDQDARAALDEWIGEESTWALFADFPDTQCINLYSSSGCYPDQHLSVSGLKVDMSLTSKFSGQFTLDSDGRLKGAIAHPKTTALYPATIEIR